MKKFPALYCLLLIVPSWIHSQPVYDQKDSMIRYFSLKLNTLPSGLNRYDTVVFTRAEVKMFRAKRLKYYPSSNTFYIGKTRISYRQLKRKYMRRLEFEMLNVFGNYLKVTTASGRLLEEGHYFERNFQGYYQSYWWNGRPQWCGRMKYGKRAESWTLYSQLSNKIARSVNYWEKETVVVFDEEPEAEKRVN